MLKVALLVLTLALANASLDSDWAIFKKTYNRDYSGDEDVLRRYIYQSNMEKVEKHNELYAQGKSSYYMGENQFSDWTREEFSRRMNGLDLKVDPDTMDKTFVDMSGLPKSVDWRTKGWVTPVKNQGDCGSCYAFSAIGSLEGQQFNKTKKLVSLSESNLVDCSGPYGNQGCDGGLMNICFMYIMANKGVDTEESYPYVPQQESCKFKRSDVGATVTSFQNVQKGSEAALQAAVANVGPISIAIDASHDSFQSYKGGVYNEPQCSSTVLDHGVTAVGYGTTSDGTDYWIVKNSWGTGWGNKGYIWMSRNKNNQCGIATAASFPLTA